MEVSKSFSKKLSCNLQEKLQENKQTISKLRKELRASSKREKELIRSRDNWKVKSKKKGLEKLQLQRKVNNNAKAKWHHYKLSFVYLCILLKVKGGCSYRAIPRVLEVLQMLGILVQKEIPCANSVENWVGKLGHYHLNKVVEGASVEEVCLIMDENLKTGNEKVMLFLTSEVEMKKEGAFKEKDVAVIYMEGKTTWTGETISRTIELRCEEKGLSISHILSDEDSKLLKATRLLGLDHLADINHVVAKCLRSVFKKNEDYQKMMSLIGTYAQKSVNQSLTYLRPPNQRKKARFMNQKPIINWGLCLLSKYNDIQKKEQIFFAELQDHYPMLRIMKKCLGISERIKNNFVTKGLNQESLKEASKWIRQVKRKKHIRKPRLMLIELLEKEMDKYRQFLINRKDTYNVSSVIIESLIGKQKQLSSKNGLVGISLQDLELPTHCLEERVIKESLRAALEGVFTSNLLEWKKEHSIESQAVKRTIFFRKCS